jgi:hypothetical protein
VSKSKKLREERQQPLPEKHSDKTDESYRKYSWVARTVLTPR